MSIKIRRAVKFYEGFKGERSLEDVLAQVPDTLKEQLTGKQLGMVMTAIDKAYHRGSKHGEQEMNDYIGLPNGVDAWAVIGGKEFPDGLHIPNILEARGQLVAQWQTEEMQNDTKRNGDARNETK